MTRNWSWGRSRYILVIFYEDGRREEREGGREYSNAKELASIWRAKEGVKQVVVVVNK